MSTISDIMNKEIPVSEKAKELSQGKAPLDAFNDAFKYLTGGDAGKNPGEFAKVLAVVGELYDKVPPQNRKNMLEETGVKIVVGHALEIGNRFNANSSPEIQNSQAATVDIALKLVRDLDMDSTTYKNNKEQLQELSRKDAEISNTIQHRSTDASKNTDVQNTDLKALVTKGNVKGLRELFEKHAQANNGKQFEPTGKQISDVRGIIGGLKKGNPDSEKIIEAAKAFGERITDQKSKGEFENQISSKEKELGIQPVKSAAQTPSSASKKQDKSEPVNEEKDKKTTPLSSQPQVITLKAPELQVSDIQVTETVIKTMNLKMPPLTVEEGPEKVEKVTPQKGNTADIAQPSSSLQQNSTGVEPQRADVASENITVDLTPSKGQSRDIGTPKSVDAKNDVKKEKGDRDAELANVGDQRAATIDEANRSKEKPELTQQQKDRADELAKLRDQRAATIDEANRSKEKPELTQQQKDFEKDKKDLANDKDFQERLAKAREVARNQFAPKQPSTGGDKAAAEIGNIGVKGRAEALQKKLAEGNNGPENSQPKRPEGTKVKDLVAEHEKTIADAGKGPDKPKPQRPEGTKVKDLVAEHEKTIADAGKGSGKTKPLEHETVTAELVRATHEEAESKKIEGRYQPPKDKKVQERETTTGPGEVRALESADAAKPKEKAKDASEADASLSGVSHKGKNAIAFQILKGAGMSEGRIDGILALPDKNPKKEAAMKMVSDFLVDSGITSDAKGKKAKFTDDQLIEKLKDPQKQDALNSAFEKQVNRLIGQSALMNGRSNFSPSYDSFMKGDEKSQRQAQEAVDKGMRTKEQNPAGHQQNVENALEYLDPSRLQQVGRNVVHGLQDKVKKAGSSSSPLSLKTIAYGSGAMLLAAIIFFPPAVGPIVAFALCAVVATGIAKVFDSPIFKGLATFVSGIFGAVGEVGMAVGKAVAVPFSLAYDKITGQPLGTTMKSIEAAMPTGTLFKASIGKLESTQPELKQLASFQGKFDAKGVIEGIKSQPVKAENIDKGASTVVDPDKSKGTADKGTTEPKKLPTTPIRDAKDTSTSVVVDPDKSKGTADKGASTVVDPDKSKGTADKSPVGVNSLHGEIQKLTQPDGTFLKPSEVKAARNNTVTDPVASTIGSDTVVADKPIAKPKELPTPPNATVTSTVVDPDKSKGTADKGASTVVDPDKSKGTADKGASNKEPIKPLSSEIESAVNNMKEAMKPKKADQSTAKTTDQIGKSKTTDDLTPSSEASKKQHQPLRRAQSSADLVNKSNKGGMSL